MKNDHTRQSGIPDVQLIDLDNNSTNSKPANDEVIKEDASVEVSTDEDASVEDASEDENFLIRGKWIHFALGGVFLLVIIVILFHLFNWGEKIDLSEIKPDDEVTYMDVLDQILPLTDEKGLPIEQGAIDNIILFGNGPFADDYYSDDNLGNMIAKETGATVYNCSVSGSYLASEKSNLTTDLNPMDIFCPYWLLYHKVYEDLTLIHNDAADLMAASYPVNAADALETLNSVNLEEIDVAVFCYDATDYLMGHPMYDDGNDTNVKQFTGDLQASVELLQRNYPNIRIIVLSPPYAYGINEKGEYVSSDQQRYGQDVLSTYVIKEYASCAARSVTFVDNLYGTITEDNAKDYLVDNLHLNVEGRKKMLERFLYALNYFNK